MAWIYFQELVETLSPLESGLKQSPIVTLNDTHKVSYSQGCAQVILSQRQSGTTSEPLQKNSSMCLLISSWEDSLAKTLVSQEKVQESKMENDQDSSLKSCDLSENLIPPLFFSKTSLPLEPEDSTSFYKNLPKQGMIVDGQCYRLQVSVPTIKGRGGSCLAGNGLPWPTPNANMTNRSKEAFQKHRTRPGNKSGGMDLTVAVQMWPTPSASMVTMADMIQAKYAGNDPKRPKYSEAKATGGALNPTWVELLMGFPPGWTVLTPDVQKWLKG